MGLKKALEHSKITDLMFVQYCQIRHFLIYWFETTDWKKDNVNSFQNSLL